MIVAINGVEHDFDTWEDTRMYFDAHEKEITTLELIYIQDPSLPNGIFSGLSSLQKLTLKNKQLTSLPDGIFSGLTSLETLLLGDNELTSLPERIFSDLRSLRELALDSNSLTSLHDGYFSELSSLQYLRLSNNQLTSLPNNFFSGLTSLRELRLDTNRLTSLPNGIFSDLKLLQNLILYKNRLTTLPDGIFSDLKSLEQLALFNNHLTSLPDGIFSGLTSLQELQLSNNQLSSLPKGIFSDLKSLELLVLRNNYLTSLPKGIFSGTTSLRELDLDANELTSLPDGIFSGLKSLKNLYVDVPLSLVTIVQLKITSPEIRLTQDNENQYVQWLDYLKDLTIKRGLNYEKEMWWEPWCNIGSHKSQSSLLQKIETDFPELYIDNLDTFSKRELCKYLALVHDTILSPDSELIKKCVPNTDIGGTHFSIGDVIGFEYSEGEYHCFSRNDFEQEPKLLQTNPYTMQKWSSEQVSKIREFLQNKFYIPTINIRPVNEYKIDGCIRRIVRAFEAVGNNYVTNELVRKVVERSTTEELLFNRRDLDKLMSSPLLETKICIVAEKIKDGEYLNDVYSLFNPDERIVDEDALEVPSVSTIEKSINDIYLELVDLQRRIMTLTNIRDAPERTRLSRERDQLLSSLSENSRAELTVLINNEPDQNTKEIADIIRDKM
jgi:Leucine-rich repeat (LRR) protein